MDKRLLQHGFLQTEADNDWTCGLRAHKPNGGLSRDITYRIYE